MSTYGPRHAELYDAFYSEKAYGREAAFIAERIKVHSPNRPLRRVLDLACGTGSHALALNALGFEVFGVDASEAMLNLARRKITIANAPVRVARQDMRTLELGTDSGAPFDVAVCLFDSIGHAVDDTGVTAVLAGMWRHVAPGGLAILEFWHGPAFVRLFDRYRVNRLTIPGGEVLRVSETEVDLIRQIATVRYTFYEMRNDGTYQSSIDTVPVRFFGIAEMAGLLRNAGFEPLAFYNGFSVSPPIDEHSVHVVGVARQGI